MLFGQVKSLDTSFKFTLAKLFPATYLVIFGSTLTLPAPVAENYDVINNGSSFPNFSILMNAGLGVVILPNNLY